METIEATDRYDVLGPPNGCRGPCEGTGVVPVYCAAGDHRLDGIALSDGLDETDPVLLARWREAEATEATDDGWHFVPCPKGTGVVPVYCAAGDHRLDGIALSDGLDETDPVLLARWREAEVTEATDDGWHFVPCPSCRP